MTQKPKTQLFDRSGKKLKNTPTPQLFNSPGFLCAILSIPLAGLFVFITIYNPPFFIIFAGVLFVTLLYLLYLHNNLAKKQSEADLRIQSCNEQANLSEVNIEQEKNAIDSIRGKIVNFAQLKGFTEKLSMCLSLDDTSKTLSTEVNRLFGDKETTIILYLFHSKTGELGISSSQKGQMRVNIKSKKGDIFDQWLVKTMQPLLIEDIKSDYRFDVDRVVSKDSREIVSLISVPMMIGNKALGILRIDSSKGKHFMTEDLRFLTTIGDLGAVATENAQLYERVEQLAIKDSLTGLYLRRYLLDRVPEEISRQIRHKSDFAFLMFDLDKFKTYNDNFGHVAGDVVLRAIGKLLADFFNEPGMLVCRYGGEEFSVLLPDCDLKRAKELAEEIRKKIAAKIIVLRRQKSQITVSIGIAMFPKNAQNMVELIHKADLALYQAKEKGRNRVCVAP